MSWIGKIFYQPPAAGGPPPHSGDRILMADGASFILMADGVSRIRRAN